MQNDLLGRMMNFPLTLTHFLARARTFFPKGEIVTALPDKTQCRISYASYSARTAKLANALTVKLGVKKGDRVATLAFNHGPHLEAYLAIPCVGAVLHTLNLRLHPTELGYIAKHGEDTIVFCDDALLPLLEKFRADVPSLRQVVVFRNDPNAPRTAPLPDGCIDYEDLLADQPVRIPAAVPALVVAAGHFRRDVQTGHFAAVDLRDPDQHLGADRAVRLNHRALGCVQPTRLQERVPGDAEQPDVVHRGDRGQDVRVVFVLQLLIMARVRQRAA